MRHSASRAVALFSVATLAAAAGCDRLTATATAVSVVTRTPTLADATPPLPANLAPLIQIDASAMGLAAAMAGVQERDSVTATTTTPVTGATVDVAWGGKRASLCEQSSPAGTYAGSSASAGAGGPCQIALEYTPDVEYTTTVETSTDEFTLKVVAPDRVSPQLVDFTPALGSSSLGVTTATPQGFGLKKHAMNSALDVFWSRDPSAAERRMIVTMLRVQYKGSSTDPLAPLQAANWQFDSNPAYDNTPKTPAAMADFVINKGEPTIQIPASSFNVKGLYVLVLTSTEVNESASGNLSYGSGAMAGYGSAFTFFVE